MIKLPKNYHNDRSGNFPQHVGKPKISYSQYTSWKDPLYKAGYIRQYFFGIPSESGIYAEFGSAVGEYMETLEVNTKWLTEDDVKVLGRIERPANAIYEGEIVIDREAGYVIQGFIDQEFLTEDGNLTIQDFKTGNTTTKKSFYAGPDYQQTTVYSYAREQQGFNIGYSGVLLIGRKGRGTVNDRLRLSGDLIPIPTPYSKLRAESALASIDKVAKEISDMYEIYLKTK